MNAPCPCGSGGKLKKCCARLHVGTPASDAQALMRARYSAYAAGHVDFILATTHPDCAEFKKDTAAWRREVNQFSRCTTFVGLDILHHETNGDTGTVTFRARLRQGNRDVTFTEKSQFVRQTGRWLYRSGERLADRS